MTDDLRRGRVQGIVIALGIVAIAGIGIALAVWYLNRPQTPDVGAPVYQGAKLERTIENHEDAITSYYFLAPANRDQLFDFVDTVRNHLQVRLACLEVFTPCMFERQGGQLFFAREVPIDSALLQTGCLHQVLKRTSVIPPPIE